LGPPTALFPASDAEIASSELLPNSSEFFDARRDVMVETDEAKRGNARRHKPSILNGGWPESLLVGSQPRRSVTPGLVITWFVKNIHDVRQSFVSGRTKRHKIQRNSLATLDGF